MLFHSLLHEDSGVYLMQDRYRIGGAIDETAFLEAWRQVVALHPSLRASFQWKTQKQPVQVIHREVKVPLDTLDLRGLAPHEQQARIRTLLEEEQKVGFNLSKPPLIRFRLVRLADEAYEFIRSFHHILMDAWCISLVTVDFLKVYEALCNQRTPQISAPGRFATTSNGCNVRTRARPSSSGAASCTGSTRRRRSPWTTAWRATAIPMQCWWTIN
ncbi:condensation domain-containing protein [Pseudomonas sp. RTB3]|nr:condensation domain-containing protein [Pseudomonas sp. RTB3]